MISSISSYLKILPVVIVLSSGCAGTVATVPAASADTGGKHRIAVLPVENLSGQKAPLKELRQKLAEQAHSIGFDVVREDDLNEFMARYRVRYTGGVDEETAQAFARDLRVEAVLVTSLEYFSDSNPPRISLTSRLVSAEKVPEILWMDSIGMSGNDSPGIFGLGLISDARELTNMALHQLVMKLSGGFTANQDKGRTKETMKVFPPKVFYRSDLAPGKQFRVAALPFYNVSVQKNAGEIMTLHFIQELRKLGNFHVIEPGVLRHNLLQFRLVMAEGVSLANADVVFDVLQANLLVTGKAYNYLNEQGELGIPRVEFSALAIDKSTHRTVLSSESYNSGDDRVVFFDFGRITTAHDVAMEMVRGITTRIGSLPDAPASESEGPDEHNKGRLP